jgi:hypothetical protein
MSDSSLIQAPGLTKNGVSQTSGNSTDGQNDNGSPNSKTTAKKTLTTLWASILDAVKSFLSFLFSSAVDFVAAFVTAVIEQENVKTAFSSLIVKAMNEFMDQPDFGEKFDSAVRRVIYDKERRRVASRDIGKEVVPLVSGFVGGVAESLRPSYITRKKIKKVEHASSNGSSDKDTSTRSTGAVAIVEKLELDAPNDKKCK